MSSDAPQGGRALLPDSRHALRFGPFVFDTTACRLYRDDVEVHLTPKAAAVLCHLLRLPGELITKDEFFEFAWAGQHVREESLTQAISAVRHALGDSPQDSVFIQTVSGEGYRFIGEVSSACAPAVSGETEPAPATRNRVWKPAVAAVATVVIPVVAWLSWPDPAVRPAIRSLAVLPLEDLARDVAESYFTEAMTDVLSAELGQVGSLRVIAPISTRRYESTDKLASEIAAELGVDALINGSVLRDGAEVRIIVRLVDGRSGEQLQSWTFRRPLRDAVSVQSEVARAIVDEIAVVLTPDETTALMPPPPVAIEALDEWALGTRLVRNRLGDGLAEAIEHFEHAMALEPRYADALVGLGIAYVQLGTYGLLPPLEAFPRARRAAREALEIDAAKGEAHITLAWTSFVYEHDFDAARRAFARGIELSPSYFGGHHQLAWFQSALGEFDQASESMTRARQLDPLSLVSHAQSAAPFYFRRSFDLALGHAMRAQEMDPNFGNAYVQLGRICLVRGDPERAVEAFERGWALTPHPRLLGELGLAYGAVGRAEEAAATMSQLEEISRSRYVEPLAFAWAYMGIGERESAIKWLRRALEDGGNPLPLMIEWDPKYDPLRGDPSFEALVADVRALRR